MKNQAASCIKFEDGHRPYHRTATNFTDETAEGSYSPKIKRRQNLYDISSIHNYKSIYKLSQSNQKQLKKIIVVSHNNKKMRKLSKVETTVNNALVKDNDSFFLKKHSSMLRIDVSQKKNSKTTRKETDLKSEVQKLEAHGNIREISHEYSVSTNVNSKGSSVNNSTRDNIVMKKAAKGKIAKNAYNKSKNF